MFFELRQYVVRPGQQEKWVKCMEEEIIPFQVSNGMVICGSYRGETDESVYVWIRRFDSEEQRVAQYKAVYESDYWKTQIAPRVPTYLDRFRPGGRFGLRPGTPVPKAPPPGGGGGLSVGGSPD